MKRTITLFLSLLMVAGLYAQSDLDALRFSTQDLNYGSARSMGIGSSLGAVGADPSIALSNPAGFAQYRSNAFHVSLGILTNKNAASYGEGEDYHTTRYGVGLPTLGLVFSDRKMRGGQYAKSGWVNTNFSMGYLRTNTFNRRVSYEGLNTQNSMLDYVADYVQGLHPGEMDANEEQLRDGFYYFENMFWYAYLIDTLEGGIYTPVYDQANVAQFQEGSIHSSGSSGELNLSFAANYSHKLYLGFSVGIEHVDYNERNTFTEYDNPDGFGQWNYFDFDRHLNTRGTAYTGRFGVILLPMPTLRIGASISTPKVQLLEDNYYDDLTVVYTDGSSEELTTLDKTYEYTLVSPMRYGLQGTFFLGGLGFVSAEVEQVDYSTMAFMVDGTEFDDVNQRIANTYRNATNLKLGGELAMDKLRLRAGVAHMGDPYADERDLSRNSLSFGMGLNEANWAFDFAYVRTWTNDSYLPYSSGAIVAPQVQSQLEGKQVVFTLTRKF